MIIKKISMNLKHNIYILYSLIFWSMALIIFFLFFYLLGDNATLIDSIDGIDQYIRGTIYGSSRYKDIIHELIHNHRLIWNEWEFGIGEGADIFHTHLDKVIASPLFFLSVFFNETNMYICYNLVSAIRLYLSGLAFLFFIKTKFENPGICQSLSSTLLYVFSYWGIRHTVSNPQFLLPFIFFPLVISGIDRIIKGKRGIVLTLSTFMLCFGWLYMFYMVGLMAAVYTTVELLVLFHKNIKLLLRKLLHILFSFGLGILMSMATLLPTLYTLIINPRVGVKHMMSPIKDPEWFISFLGDYIGIEGHYGVTSVSIIAVILLFAMKNKHTLLKIFVLITFVMLSCNYFGSIMNGLSYPSGRWIFALPLLYSYILFIMWDELVLCFKQYALNITYILLILFMLCMLFEETRITKVFASIGISLFIIVLLSHGGFSRAIKEYIVLCASICCAFLNSFFYFSPSADNMISELIKVDDYSSSVFNNESKAVEAVARLEYGDAAPFFRYSGDLEANTGLLKHLSSTSFYSSNVSPYSWMFRKNIALADIGVHKYLNYDDRTNANAISSVKYYVCKDENSLKLPYGYSFLGEIDINKDVSDKIINDYKQVLTSNDIPDFKEEKIRTSNEKKLFIYKNDYALPLGITYDSYMKYEDYLRLPPPEEKG